MMHNNPTKDIPAAHVSNEKIAREAPFALAFLKRNNAEDLAEMLGVETKEN